MRSGSSRTCSGRRAPGSRRGRDDEVDGLEPLLARREAREPLAYVLGEWGFRRLTLKTDARALVPRPETETLVERALALARGNRAAADPRRRRRLGRDRARAQGRAAGRAGDRRRRLGRRARARARERRAARARGRAAAGRRRGCRGRGLGRRRREPAVRREPRRTSSRSCAGSRRSHSSASGEHERLARAAKARFIVLRGRRRPGGGGRPRCSSGSAAPTWRSPPT